LHDDAVCALALARYCSQKNKKGIFVIIWNYQRIGTK
jgi:hypothetical protein